MPSTARRARRTRLAVVWAVLLPALLVGLLVAAKVGATSASWSDVGHALLFALGFPPEQMTPAARIVAGVRLPRVFLAATAGAALGLAGGLQSGAFRSALAAPVTTGSAAGALLGVALAIGFGGGQATDVLTGAPSPGRLFWRIVAASMGAAGATYGVLRLARVRGTIAVAPLLLAGLAVNALVGSIAAAALFLGPAGAQTAATLVVNWSFGGLLAVAQPRAWAAPLAGLVVAASIALPVVRALDLILLGEEDAAAAGVDLPRVRATALGAAAVATGAAVALVGVVAFLGLLAPALIRSFTGPGHARLLPAATVLGAILLVSADALGRAISGPVDLPAGVVTAALGAPMLMVLLGRGLREVSA